MSFRKNLALLATTLLLSLNSYAEGEIAIENAWVRTAPPAAKVLAAYMEISNHSNQPQTLVTASSPQFNTVELHQTQMHNGMMHMKAVPNISIAKHETLHIKPGGYHFMLIGPKARIHRGDKITLKLNFSGNETITVEAEVKDSTDNTHSNHGAHHH